jgi:hypothetical protein
MTDLFHARIALLIGIGVWAAAFCWWAARRRRD